MNRLSLMCFMVCLLILVPAYADEVPIFDMTLGYDRGDVSIPSLEVTYGYPDVYNDKDAEGYRLQLLDRDTVIFERSFKFPLLISFIPPPILFNEQGEQTTVAQTTIIESNESELFMRIPFLPNTTLVRVLSRDGEELVQKSICNLNSICESRRGENTFSCPSDCLSGGEDFVCDIKRDGWCDPDCVEETDFDCHCGDGVCDRELGEGGGRCLYDCKIIHKPTVQAQDTTDTKPEEKGRNTILLIAVIILTPVALLMAYYSYSMDEEE